MRRKPFYLGLIACNLLIILFLISLAGCGRMSSRSDSETLTESRMATEQPTAAEDLTEKENPIETEPLRETSPVQTEKDPIIPEGTDYMPQPYQKNYIFPLGVESKIFSWLESIIGEGKCLAYVEIMKGFYTVEEHFEMVRNEQLPVFYEIMRMYDIDRETFMGAPGAVADIFSEEQLDALFSGDDREVMRTLKAETALYYDGKLYNLYTLSLLSNNELKRLPKEEVRSFLENYPLTGDFITARECWRAVALRVDRTLIRPSFDVSLLEKYYPAKWENTELIESVVGREALQSALAEAGGSPAPEKLPLIVWLVEKLGVEKAAFEAANAAQGSPFDRDEISWIYLGDREKVMEHLRVRTALYSGGTLYLFEELEDLSDEELAAIPGETLTEYCLLITEALRPDKDLEPALYDRAVTLYRRSLIANEIRNDMTEKLLALYPGRMESDCLVRLIAGKAETAAAVSDLLKTDSDIPLLVRLIGAMNISRDDFEMANLFVAREIRRTGRIMTEQGERLYVYSEEDMDILFGKLTEEEKAAELRNPRAFRQNGKWYVLENLSWLRKDGLLKLDRKTVESYLDGIAAEIGAMEDPSFFAEALEKISQVRRRFWQ